MNNYPPGFRWPTEGKEKRFDFVYTVMGADGESIHEGEDWTEVEVFDDDNDRQHAIDGINEYLKEKTPALLKKHAGGVSVGWDWA